MNMQIFDASQYQDRTTSLYEQHRSRIARRVTDARIEHVGASSIPGACSRGDVDICVIVPLHRHPACIAELEQIGYVVKHDTFRSNELCMLVDADPAVPVAIQLVALHSRFEFFLLFRDALRADVDLLARYNAAKKQWAQGDEGTYRAAKSAFIEGVLRDAAAP